MTLQRPGTSKSKRKGSSILIRPGTGTRKGSSVLNRCKGPAKPPRTK